MSSLDPNNNDSISRSGGGNNESSMMADHYNEPERSTTSATSSSNANNDSAIDELFKKLEPHTKKLTKEALKLTKEAEKQLRNLSVKFRNTEFGKQSERYCKQLSTAIRSTHYGKQGEMYCIMGYKKTEMYYRLLSIQVRHTKTSTWNQLLFILNASLLFILLTVVMHWFFSGGERNFKAIATLTGTEKVKGYEKITDCPGCVRDKCQTKGHFYDTLYQRWLGPMSTNNAQPFQLVEVGYFRGQGREAYEKFLPKAEIHSLEISCLPPGPREEGKWPYDNTAEEHPDYAKHIKNKRLHCGDATDTKFLDKVWSNEMNRDYAPPLMVVVDDGAHMSKHMAQSFLYWFPKIEPGGFMIIEGVQAIGAANSFRTQFLPQIMSDLHYCGHPKLPENPFFPDHYPLLASISCEMNICVFERNSEPANLELSTEKLQVPHYALDYNLAIAKTRIKE